MNTKDLKEALSKGKKRLWELHPKLNDFQISQLLTIEFYKRTGQAMINYKDAVHMRRPLTNTAVQHYPNYYCYNGSAHLKTTTDKSHVTCVECLKAM